MTDAEKAAKYDEIVQLWNEELANPHNDIWYLLLGSYLVEDIQRVIADDITEVTEKN